MTVKIKLKQLLEAKEMSQAELAKLTGIRPSTISDLCNGKADFIKLEHISAICKALLCGIGDLMSLTDD